MTDNSHCSPSGIIANNWFAIVLSIRIVGMCDITGRSKLTHFDRARQTQLKEKD